MRMDYFKILLIFLIAMPAQVFADISSGDGGYITLGVPNSEITLTAEERVFLNNHDLRCAMAPSWPPINMYDQNKQLVGIAIDYWKLISKRLYINVDCDIKESYSEVLQAIENRDADFMLATSMTDERKGYAEFSKAYVSFPIAIATTVDKDYMADETALVGKRVAVGRGYSAHKILTKDNPDIEFVEVDNTRVGLQMLAANEVFAVVDSLPVLQQLIKQGKHNTIKIAGTARYDIGLRLMVRSDYPQLAVIFNKAIDMISAQEHKIILSRWLDPAAINDQSIVFTPAEQAWISENHPIRVSFWKHQPLFYLKDGKVVGIAVDLLNKISADTGLSFQYENRLDLFADVLKGLKDQNGPDLVGALMPTAEREKSILFTRSYFSSPRFIFTRDDSPFISSIENLNGKNIAVVKDYVIHHTLVEKYPDIDLLIFQDNEEALRAVSIGKAFAFIGDLVATPAMINEFGLKNIKAACPSGLPDHPLAMGIRNDWPELRNIIDKALDAMPAYEKAAILNKWNSVQFDYGISPHDVKKWVLIFGSSVISIFFLVVFWNRSLARRVKERTITLSESEEALRGSELRFRATFEQAAVGIAHVSPDGHFLRINQKFCDIVGYSRAEMRALTFQDITHPDDLDADVAEVQRLLDGEGDTYSIDKRYIHKNGSIVWINLTVSLIRDDDAQPKWFAAVVKDITERKQTENALQKSEESFRSLTEQSPFSMIIFNTDGTIKKTNTAWMKLWGLSNDDLPELYEKYNVLEDEQIRMQGVKYIVDRAFMGENVEMPPLEYDAKQAMEDVNVPTRNPLKRWIHVRLYPVKDQRGELIHVAFVQEDITERKLAEDGLRQSRDYLQFLTDSLADAVFSIKMPERTIEWVNDSYQVLGYTQEECIGESTEKFYSDPDAYLKLGVLMDETIKSAQQVVSFEAMLRRSNGEIIPAEVKTTFYREHGKVVSATALVRDVTERYRAEQLLKGSEEKFRSLVEQSPVAIQIHALDGRLLQSNAAYARLYALNEETLAELYEKYNVLQDEQVMTLGVMPYIEQAFNGEDVIFPPYEYDVIDTLKTLDVNQLISRKCWVQTRGFALKDNDGKMTKVVFMSTDITESMKAEQALLDYQLRLKSLSAEVVRTEDRERRKIATELHDHVGQSLAVMRIQLAAASKESEGRKLESILHEVSGSLLQAVKDTRNIITELSPPTLNELGLSAAIMELLNEQIEDYYGLKVQFNEDAEPVLLSDEAKAILYRSVRELLINVVKHASAHSVSVSITQNQDFIQIDVEDDGIGLVNGQVPKRKISEGGFGLFSIEERMKDIGGSLSIEQRPGNGLRATLITPLDN